MNSPINRLCKSFARFFALIVARNKEFIRDTGSLTWTFAFPVLVIAGFGFAFSGGEAPLFKVGVIGTEASTTSNTTTDSFLKTKYLSIVNYATEEEAVNRLRHHATDLVYSPKDSNYWLNDTSAKGYLVEKLLLAEHPKLKRQTVTGREIRYVDWLISGLLSMNMMFSALFGVGYTIVRYRKTGVLKRLKATPILAVEFLGAQITSRLIVMMAVSTLVFVGCNAFIHFQMLGSYLDLFIVMTAGACCLISIGLLVAAFISSEELAGGLLNVVTWPMMFLSGVWFSLDGLNPVIKKVALFFPLTHVIDSARAIMTEGATLASQSFHLAVLGSLTLVFLTISSLFFRWE